MATLQRWAGLCVYVNAWTHTPTCAIKGESLYLGHATRDTRHWVTLCLIPFNNEWYWCWGSPISNTGSPFTQFQLSRTETAAGPDLITEHIFKERWVPGVKSAYTHTHTHTHTLVIHRRRCMHVLNCCLLADRSLSYLLNSLKSRSHGVSFNAAARLRVRSAFNSLSRRTAKVTGSRDVTFTLWELSSSQQSELARLSWLAGLLAHCFFYPWSVFHRTVPWQLLVE